MSTTCVIPEKCGSLQWITLCTCHNRSAARHVFRKVCLFCRWWSWLLQIAGQVFTRKQPAFRAFARALFESILRRVTVPVSMHQPRKSVASAAFLLRMAGCMCLDREKLLLLLQLLLLALLVPWQDHVGWGRRPRRSKKL